MKYKSEIEYLANKVMTLWRFIPLLVINGGINYKGGAHEVNARLTEKDELIAFMKAGSRIKGLKRFLIQ